MRDVKQSCVWQNMPRGIVLPDAEGGRRMEGLVMCRRKREAEKRLEAPEAEGLWSSGPKKYGRTRTTLIGRHPS